MKKQKQFLCLLICLLSGVISFKSNDDLSKVILSALNTYRNEYPQEKVYLHLDRTHYGAGETIWYKAYVLAGPFHQETQVSNVLYVELLDEQREVIHREKKLIQNGSTSGDIRISGKVRTGTYVIRAYTSWMQNFNHQYFFTRELSLWNDEKVIQSGAAASNLIDIQFFPEGGALIDGLLCRVAFKAIQPDGLGKSVSGKVYNDENHLVWEFTSAHLGMGQFSSVFYTNRKYFAVLDEEPGQRYNLPKVQESGVAMRVTNIPDKPEVIIRLQKNKKTLNCETVTLVTQSRGVLTYTAKVDLSSNISFVTIPKAGLSDGITHITLFDQNNRPINERLIAIEWVDDFIVDIKPSQEAFKPREKVAVEVTIRDVNELPFIANFSITVVDSDQVPHDPNGISITSDVLLRSEVTGYIESPGYYFNPDNADRHEALDLLLLTQGWSRFSWSEILNNRWPEKVYPAEKGLSVKGTLVDSFSKKPIKNGKVHFLSLEEYSSIETDDSGNFIFSNLMFFDSMNVYLQGESRKGSNKGEILVEPEPIPPLFTGWITPTPPDPDQLTEKLSERVTSLKNNGRIDSSDSEAIMLEAVQVKSTRLEEDVRKMNYSMPSTRINITEIGGAENFSHPLELIQGRVAGVYVTIDPPSVTIRGPGSMTQGTNPLILMDGIPVDIEFLGAMHANQFETVDIFKDADAVMNFGSRGYNGAIAFYTKKSVTRDVIMPGFLSRSLSGYSRSREFYSPRYDVQNAEHAKPDNRVTVYWNPKVQTDKMGKTSVEFFNPDKQTTVLILLEGIVHYEIPSTGIRKGIPITGKASYKIVGSN